MATLRCGIDHYQIVSDSGFESDTSVYGTPCILADEDTGDILFAYLDIPAADGSIRGAMGLGVVVYRLDLPDREEATVTEDLPDGFDFEQDEDYDSPFADDDDGEEILDGGDGGGDGEEILDGGDGGGDGEDDGEPVV
jgi:hypothetical protein